MYREGNIVSVKDDWYILSISYKWLGSKRPITHCLSDYPSFKRNPADDRHLVKDIWRLFDEADILIAHNGDRFDIRKCNARFVAHGMQPPSPYKSIDTLKIARRHFKFDSNRLDALGGYLKIGRKRPTTGAHLWLRCMAGERAAFSEMRRYNARDVELLEKVYLRLRGWASNHPDLSLYSIARSNCCPSCGGFDVVMGGKRFSKTQIRQQFQCKGCGSWHSIVVGKR